MYVCSFVYIYFFLFSGIVTETKETFLKSLRRDFPRELVPIVLAPLLYPSKSDLPMDKVNQDSSTMTNTMVCLNVCLMVLVGETSWNIFFRLSLLLVFHLIL
jgi:hypothetical protein